MFTETEGLPFEGNQLSFEPEFAQPFYIGFERWTDNEERGYTTYSEVMLVDLNNGNHQNIELGELIEFEILESSNMYFSTLIETGEVYKVDFYDRGNSNYTADAIVFGAKDYFSEGRTSSPHGRGRIFQAIDETLNLQAARALEGAFGSSALSVSPVESAIPLTFSDSMDFTLSTKNTTYVVETYLNPGIYTFHATHDGYNPETAVAATIVFEHPLESVVGGSLINIGPVGSFDPYTETRKFAVNQAGTMKIYLLTGYHGGVADYSCSLRAD